MKLLSRSEEMALLAVQALREEAYSVSIRRHLIDITGQNWSFGSVYDPLDRLERKGLLESFLTDPVRERGGRSKRVYRLTKRGRMALARIRTIQETLWARAAGQESET